MQRYTWKTLIREIAVIVIALALMTPFYLLVVTALKSDEEAFASSPFAPPVNPTFDSFVAAFAADGTSDLVRGLINSAIVTGVTVLILVTVASIAAYTLSRRPGRGSVLMYSMFLVAIILPFQLAMVPAYITLRSFVLAGTLPGMIVLYTGIMMPFAVFLYSGFTRSLAREYEEAAALDGASRFSTFRRVVFPLLGPAHGTVAILAGLFVWNDFALALVFTNGTTNATLPVMVYGFVGESVTQWNVIFAAVIVAMIPILIFYAFLQKRFIQGFAGGVKG